MELRGMLRSLDLSRPNQVAGRIASQSLLLVSLALACAGGQTISFEPARSFGAGISGRLLSGDWNGDRKTDVAALGGSRISLFEGDGVGNLRLATELDIEANVVAAADVNSDGRTDFLVLTHWADPLSAGNQELLVFLSEGEFRFAPPVRARPKGRPWIGFEVADLNQDGKPDLLVFPNGLYVSVLLGNGDGTFSDPLGTQVFFSFFLAVDDFDQDGLPDLLAGDWSGILQIQFGRGDGTFQPETVSVAGARAIYGWCGYGVADVDGDHKPDLWIGDEMWCPGLDLFRGSGRATFDTLSSLTAFTPSQVAASMLFADFNQDGFPDLVALPEIYAGDGKGGFVQGASLADLPASGRHALIVDVNGDGKPDIVASDSTLRLTLWLNNSKRSPGPPRSRR